MMCIVDSVLVGPTHVQLYGHIELDERDNLHYIMKNIRLQSLGCSKSKSMETNCIHGGQNMRQVTTKLIHYLCKQ